MTTDEVLHEFREAGALLEAIQRVLEQAVEFTEDGVKLREGGK